MDGTLLKGTTVDFYPNRASFHILPEAGGGVVEVECKQMKALFFVKSLAGSGPHRKPGFPAKSGYTQGKKIAVRFKDGELLCGYSLAYVPGREGFFMNPADSDANNLRTFVVGSSTLEVRMGADAEALVQGTPPENQPIPIKA